VPLKVLPDNVNNWLQKHAGLYTQELSSQALAAIERILSNSELKELWDDSKSAEKWYAAMSDLQDRLRT
jgi:hypothetical protein